MATEEFMYGGVMLLRRKLILGSLVYFRLVCIAFRIKYLRGVSWELLLIEVFSVLVTFPW